MDSAIDQLLSSAAETDTTTTTTTIITTIAGRPPVVEFLPSASWAGPREGYYFGTTTEEGTGYHLDWAAPAGAAGGGGDGAGPARKRARLDYTANGDDDAREGGTTKTIRFGADSTRSITSRPAHNHKKTGEELLEEAEAGQLEQHEQHQSEASAGGCGGGGSTPSTLILKPAGITRATSIDRKSK